MVYNYFDIHSHLNISPLMENTDELIQNLKEKGIGTITVGVDYTTSAHAVKLAEENPDILWATVGQHPNDNTEEIFDYEKYLELAKSDKVVAIGECGLDYFRLRGSDEEKLTEVSRQKNLFIEHIKLAKELNKPLMIHARPHVNSQDAYTDVIRILEEENFTGHVNFHFFVGDIDTAKKIISKNWSMSFDGPITFTDDYTELIKFIPIENIMCETDAPFASPAPHRGQTNYPEYVEYVYKKISEIKNIPIDELKKNIYENILKIFNINLN